MTNKDADVPQKENGYTPISSRILETLYRADFLDAKAKILLWIFRWSYGVRCRQWTGERGIRELANDIWVDAGTACRAESALLKKNIIVKKMGRYSFQKRYRSWDDGVAKMRIKAQSYPQSYPHNYPQGSPTVAKTQQGVAKTQRFPDGPKRQLYRQRGCFFSSNEKIKRKRKKTKSKPIPIKDISDKWKKTHSLGRGR